MRHFNVEILGREVSVWGGIDGHEIGTKVVGHEVCDIMDLNGNFRVYVRSRMSSPATYVVIDGDKYIVDPRTRNFGIDVDFMMYDIVRIIMGVDKINDFAKFSSVRFDLENNGLSLDEFKKILEKL